MSQQVFTVPEHVTTRQMNRFIANAINYGLGSVASYIQPVYRDVVADRYLSRAHGRYEYRHGMGNQVRATSVAVWDVTDRTLRVTVPNHYPGWDKADAYTRARMVMADRLRSMPGLVPLHNYGGGR